ncbi:MAG TPA: DUF5916 domain-containing protein, partial [Chitinophagaceae bacterium]|nr:DUF5916 domain-containing protein [Chitinophagaceae bacterium]
PSNSKQHPNPDRHIPSLRLSEGMEYGDQGWDAVWNSKVHHAENGWHVEIEIPFSAIRFARQEKMTWGINFLRSVRKLNENSYWNRVDQQKSGFLAQTGELKGMENIVPPKRIFLFPYLSTGFLHQAPDGTVSNRWMRSGGLDIKYGLSESFTLDMTLVPDFSQVISDNLVRNLSPFEQQLAENRPFFTEGTELFNKAGIFYTRRIGARPSRYYTVQGKYGNTEQYEIEKNPNVTTLLNAFKISGRNKQKLGLGIFNAVGSPMYARITDKQSGDHIREETEPLTNYNVLVVDKGFKGQSNFNFTNTNLITADAERIANVSSFMWTQFNRKESYSLKTIARFSNTRNQTDQNGSAFGLVFSKVSGRFNFTLLTDRQSKYFDKSDMGIQFEYNNSSQYAGFSYNQNKPKAKRLQLYRLGLEHKLAENTIPFQFKYYEAKASCFLLFKSFWDITYSIESKPFAPVDFYQFSAWNKKLKTNPYIYNALDGSSDSRKKLFWGYYAGFGLSNYAHTEYLFTFQSLRYRVSPRFDLILSGEMTRDNGSVGYAYFDENLNEPLAGKRDVREYNGEFSVRYNLNPNTNLTARFRHYNSFIYYHSFHQVDEEG